jgi:hypothetical protein
MIAIVLVRMLDPIRMAVKVGVAWGVRQSVRP